MSTRCRRFHPVWLTHTQMDLLRELLEDHIQEGSYWGPREQHYRRTDDTVAAINAADGNCVDENERPKR